MNKIEIPYTINQLDNTDVPAILFNNEADLITWIQNNVLSVKDVEAYLEEMGHPIQRRAVYYAMEADRLKSWRTGSGTRLTLKSWVDDCWNLTE